jgi:starvation-inducible DNA-binding protein
MVQQQPASLHTIPTRAKESAPNVASDANQRAQIAHALSYFLASTYTLYQKSLFYHWNVTGPQFVGLHQLFEEHYEELHKAGDLLAERIRALGHAAPGTLSEFSTLSSVAEDKVLPGSYREMLTNLLISHEICSKEAKQVFDTSERSGDPVTSDLMTQRMAFHDKAAWMLRALQE